MKAVLLGVFFHVEHGGTEGLRMGWKGQMEQSM